MCAAVKFLTIAFLRWVEKHEQWENNFVYLNVF